MDVNIHPLVVMTIADHTVRDHLQFSSPCVVGGVFGTKEGQSVQIAEAMGIKIERQDEHTVELDWKSFDKEHKLFKQAYPELELLGWYSNGTVPSKFASLHATFLKYTPHPLCIMLDTNLAGKEHGIAVFEHEDGGNGQIRLKRTSYKFVQDETERITLVHCAVHAKQTNSQVSTAEAQMQILLKSLDSVSERVELLHRYLADTASGKIKAEPTTLRHVKSLCSRLPTMDTHQFHKELLSDYNDSLLQTYVSHIAQTNASLIDAMSKFNIEERSKLDVDERGGGRRKGRMHMLRYEEDMY